MISKYLLSRSSKYSAIISTFSRFPPGFVNTAWKQWGMETLDNQGTSSQEETKTSEEKELEIPSEDELINIIHNAELKLLDLCVEGFDAEFHGTEKK